MALKIIHRGHKLTKQQLDAIVPVINDRMNGLIKDRHYHRMLEGYSVANREVIRALFDSGINMGDININCMVHALQVVHDGTSTYECKRTGVYLFDAQDLIDRLARVAYDYKLI